MRNGSQCWTSSRQTLHVAHCRKGTVEQQPHGTKESVRLSRNDETVSLRLSYDLSAMVPALRFCVLQPKQEQELSCFSAIMFDAMLFRTHCASRLGEWTLRTATMKSWGISPFLSQSSLSVIQFSWPHRISTGANRQHGLFWYETAGSFPLTWHPGFNEKQQ